MFPSGTSGTVRSLHCGSTSLSGPAGKGWRTLINGIKAQSKKELFTRASICNAIHADMDLSAGVPEAAFAPRQDWDGVTLIVYPLKVCDLGVKE